MNQQSDIKVNDVVQITEAHGRKGWIGCFVLVEEVKAWGVQGAVSWPETHDAISTAYIRLKWNEIERIGRAVMVRESSVAE